MMVRKHQGQISHNKIEPFNEREIEKYGLDFEDIMTDIISCEKNSGCEFDTSITGIKEKKAITDLRDFFQRLSYWKIKVSRK